MGFSIKTQVEEIPTREFPLVTPDGAYAIDLGGPGIPTLIVRHAGETNPAFYAATLKRQASESRKRTSGSSADAVRENREVDAKLIAKHVVVGWKNVVEDAPRGGILPVDFDTLRCEELLMMILADEPRADQPLRMAVFHSLRLFVFDYHNFYEPKVDGVELGKP